MLLVKKKVLVEMTFGLVSAFFAACNIQIGWSVANVKAFNKETLNNVTGHF